MCRISEGNCIFFGHNAFSGTALPFHKPGGKPKTTANKYRCRYKKPASDFVHSLFVLTVYGFAGKVTVAQTIYDQILRARKHNKCINYFKLFLRCNLRNKIKIRKGNSESGLLENVLFQ